MKEPEWLLDSTPREVQLEALRRSYYGYAFKDSREGMGVYRPMYAPAQIGWSHYLEMRLGKTPLVMNEFELFKRDHSIKRIISVCPNTFKQGWLDESIKSGASVPWTTYESNTASRKDTDALLKEEEFGVAINYEAMRTDHCKAFVEKVMEEPTALIIDESIKLKGHNSLQTKAVLAASKEAAYIRNLSGLPMTQGPQDLYGQFRAIRHFNGVNFFAFRNRFCKMGGFKNKKVVGVRNEEELYHEINQNGFMARRSDWADPRSETYYIEKLRPTEKQEKHYNELDKEFVTMLETGQEISADVVVAKIGKLQQISSGFVYHEGQTVFFEDPKKLPKMAYLMDMMDEIPGKVIVCYHYGASGDVLLDQMAAHQPATIRGKQWMQKNGRNVDSEKARFNNDPECRVMILQISAGKYGHDLSGVKDNRCATMVFYENTFSLDDRTQIEHRNTAAVQDWANTYHDFVSTKVEQTAVKALAEKKDITDSILNYYMHRCSQHED